MTENNKLPRQFGKIILTLENCLLSDNKLQETPSHQDGLNKEIETDLRILGCELIQIAGILLKLPQVAMATGQVLFQRFYYSKSYLRYDMETTAMSCIYLASKIEEAPRRIRDVINVFHHVKQMRGQKPIHPMALDSTYIALKNQVIKAERRVLKELGFCVHVKHPHKLIVMYLQVLGYEQNQNLMQMAWNFMNDSLRTDVFVRYNPESIACACIYLTARKINLPLPNNPTWYGVFKVKEDDILDISYKIMELYRRPKPNAEALDQSISKLKKEYEEARNKTKVGQTATPPVTVTTTADRNDGSHNAWGGFISRVVPQNTAVAANDAEKKATQQPISTTGQSDAQPQQTDSNNQVSQANQSSQQASHQHESTSHDSLKSSKKSSRLSRDQQKRSHSRSSRSKSGSQSPSDNNRSRNYKKSRYRSRSRTPDKRKKSPSRHLKRRDKSDYVSGNGEHSDKKHRSSDKHREYKRDRSRERDRFRGHDRYSGRGSGGGGGGGGGHRMQQDGFRDRKR